MVNVVDPVLQNISTELMYPSNIILWYFSNLACLRSSDGQSITPANVAFSFPPELQYHIDEN